MAAQELRWLTYLLADLGEPPRSPPVLYVDNKAMLALCREHRLEHRTKHIALRYFLARELQQRGQLRLACVASEANTADIFTKALPPGDHQRFCTMLGVGGVSSMGGDAIEELAIGVIRVVGVADLVSATVDVVASCRIVANARVLSTSGMDEDVIFQDCFADVKPSSTVEKLELLCGTMCFKMYPLRHQLADAQ
ncbi:unnamed protein product [Closterium sp. NIES-54]